MDFYHTSVSDDAITNAIECLQSTFLSEGKRVKEFEDRLSDTLGLCNPVAVNSGTSALHLGLALAGIGPGDEVILPPQTFIATGMAILMQGAVPIFADIQPETGNICPKSIREKLTSKTKAIMPVHWGGYPCDMDAIGHIALTNKLAVIEDAAHALGATYKGQSIGTISRFTALSFQAIKHLTTGDGGAVCCLYPEDAQHAKTLRWFGIDRANSVPSILGEREYDATELGFKYHMNDLAAAVGIGNLKYFPANLAKLRSIAQRYRTELAGIPGLQLLESNPDRESACWLFTVLVDRRVEFIERLKSFGIPTSVVHLRIDSNSVFGGLTPNLPGMEYFNDRQVAIPLHAGLTDEDVSLVIESVKGGW